MVKLAGARPINRIMEYGCSQRGTKDTRVWQLQNGYWNQIEIFFQADHSILLRESVCGQGQGAIPLYIWGRGLQATLRSQRPGE